MLHFPKIKTLAKWGDAYEKEGAQSRGALVKLVIKEQIIHMKVPFKQMQIEITLSFNS